MQPESFFDGKVSLYCGECIEVMAGLPENSVDLVCCDPPYHLQSIVDRFGKEGAAPAQDDRGVRGAYKRASAGFMGKVWDGGDIAFKPEVWRAALRVLKPGGHLFAFAAARGYGRMQVAIEDAGFETRDCILEIIDTDPRIAAFVNSLNDAQRCAFLQIVVEASDIGGLMAWMFGTGFPKSHNVALDFEKEICRQGTDSRGRPQWYYLSDGAVMARKAPFRDLRAQGFAGHGSALKPAFEPIVMARKPLIGSIAANCEAWGTGALNIDAARIGTEGATRRSHQEAYGPDGRADQGGGQAWRTGHEIVPLDQGRWPANVIHDGSAIVRASFPADARGGEMPAKRAGMGYHGNAAGTAGERVVLDAGGSASRFFYSAKADADDRLGSKHPTVKPVDLIQYLIRLGSRPGDVVLDMFAGTGTAGEAAWREGRRAILIEREAEYQADIRRRMALCLAGPDERKRESIKAKGEDQPFEAGSLFAGLA
jgi:DNA modification methylase